MFHNFIGSVLEVVMGLVLLVSLYYIFISDWVDDLRARMSLKSSQSKGEKIKTSNLAKIAKMKLVSDDIKGIENFITENAQYLSDIMVNQLVSRIEYLRADKVVAASENSLKQKIEELEPEEEEVNLMSGRKS